MRDYFWILLAALLFVANAVADDYLPVDQQLRILNNLQHVMGHRDGLPQVSAEASDDETRHWCGTSSILEYLQNKDRIDSRLIQSLGIEIEFIRPDSLAPLIYDSPAGYFRIHYSTSDTEAVYQANVDSDGDGVPDFVESTALIADSVYEHIVNMLGYGPPIIDTLCPNGGDEKVDLYLRNLGAPYFGYTVAKVETGCSGFPVLSAPAWLEVENDFAHLSMYRDRPLDAMRVTIAHEFFHVIHFSLDWTESPVLYEMTSTWMEEEIYDDINDYYTIIPKFLERSKRSIQSELNLHHYGAAVFPIYLEEKFGTPDIIRETWFHSRDLPPTSEGGNYLQAFNEVIDSISGGTDSLATALTEFYLWNYFTGPYAQNAPNGIGYSEAEFYSEVPLDTHSFAIIDSLPLLLNTTQNAPNTPEINGTVYVRFEHTQNLVDNLGNQDTTLNPFFTMNLGGSTTIQWGISTILEFAEPVDSHTVTSELVFASSYAPVIQGVQKYRTVTFVFTPLTTIGSWFSSGSSIFDPRLAFIFSDSLDFTFEVDPNLANLESAILSPYPNPAVMSELPDGNVNFRFQVATTDSQFYDYSSAKLIVDIYTVAGEHVAAVERPFTFETLPRDDPRVIDVVFETDWDTRNNAGKPVASGAYLAYARLMTSTSPRTVLAEDHVKVAIIR